LRAIRHASNPAAVATPARNAQNHAKPFASAATVGSVIPPSELNPVTATLKHMAAKIAATTAVAWIESFRVSLSLSLRAFLTTPA
jgi:hypothetical protein